MMLTIAGLLVAARPLASAGCWTPPAAACERCCWYALPDTGALGNDAHFLPSMSMSGALVMIVSLFLNCWPSIPPAADHRGHGG